MCSTAIKDKAQFLIIKFNIQRNCIHEYFCFVFYCWMNTISLCSTTIKDKAEILIKNNNKVIVFNSNKRQFLFCLLLLLNTISLFIILYDEYFSFVFYCVEHNFFFEDYSLWVFLFCLLLLLNTISLFVILY